MSDPTPGSDDAFFKLRVFLRLAASAQSISADQDEMNAWADAIEALQSEAAALRAEVEKLRGALRLSVQLHRAQQRPTADQMRKLDAALAKEGER